MCACVVISCEFLVINSQHYRGLEGNKAFFVSFDWIHLGDSGIFLFCG